MAKGITRKEALARLASLNAPIEMIEWAKRVIGPYSAEHALFTALCEIGHGAEARQVMHFGRVVLTGGDLREWETLESRREEDRREEYNRQQQIKDKAERARDAKRRRIRLPVAKSADAEAARIDFTPVLLAMEPAIAYDFPERSRPLCVQCESAPVEKSPPSGGHINAAVDFGTRTVFCSSRCESEFFGPAGDWSTVYLEEIDRTGARPTSLPPADGPESWKEGHFVRHTTHLSMPQGRKHAPIRRWSKARLSRIEQPGRGLRPAIALGGKAGHLAEVSGKTK